MTGFPVTEFEARTAKAQRFMADAGIDALFLTTEPDFRYFSGFLTRFWESPTRPWFLIVPAQGKPVAVIPGIGSALMARTWIDDIRTWDAPDLEDDGVSLLAATLMEFVPASGCVGVPDGHESHVRMPLADLEKLKALMTGRNVTGDAGIMRRLRMVKSNAEIAKVETACRIAGRAFDRVAEIAQTGTRLDQVFREFQILCLQEGADWVPYLAGGAGKGGYEDVISPASGHRLAIGDVLMLDTGLVHDGYFCDFDRNWSIGPASGKTKAAFEVLIEATEAGFSAACPGRTAADIYEVMKEVLSKAGADTGAGRLGHGLGMTLTEWPSLIEGDTTVLEPNMILTLEPGIATGGGILVHEENIVITDNGARYLSQPADRTLREL